MKLKNVLVYGHSQAQPSGMGDDMVAALKAKGVKFKRVGLQGRNDGGLLQEYADQGLGDPAQYDTIFLYGHGNNSTEAQTQKLVAFLGPERTVLVLPPVNVDRVVPDATAEQRLAKQKQRLDTFPGLLGVPVYGIWGNAQDFKNDEVHMRPGTKVGKGLVARMLQDREGGSIAPGLLVGGLVALAVVLALATRRR